MFPSPPLPSPYLLAGVIKFSRRDLSAFDTSQQLPRRVWRTFPDGLPLLEASAGGKDHWEAGGVTDPFPFAAPDGTAWLAYASQGGGGVGVVQLVGVEGEDGELASQALVKAGKIKVPVSTVQ